jgi:sec-independent protein translocase protein TatC
MLLTPPDVISQSLLAVPVWMLFEVGIFFGRFVKSREAEESSDEPRESL